MNRSFLLRALLVLSALAVGVPACTTHESDAIRPQAALPSTLTVADARNWYQAQAGPLQTAAAARGASPTQTVSGPLPIDWANAADTTADAHAVVFAPVRDFGRRFTDAGYQTFRYLVVTRSGPTQPSGMVVEVFLKDIHQPSKAVARALLAQLYTHHRSVANTLPGNFTGHAFFYSADYHYLTGTGYKKGKALACTMRLTRAVPVTTSPKKNSTANKTTGCTTYLIKGGTDSAYYEEICGTEPDFGNLDLGQPGFYDPGYGGTWNAPITGGGGIGGGSGSSSITVILNFSLAPCQTAVLNNLQNLNNGMLAFIVQQFGGTATGYNWKLYNGTLPTGTYGSTSPYDRASHSITTTFDAGQWQNATDLSIARTMMHESVHAYLLAFFANEPALASANYPDLIAAYATYGGNNPNIPHHNVMGQNGWLGDMAWGLQQYGESLGYTLPAQYYADMAWGGLETSQPFLALPIADQNRIKDLLRVEATGKDQLGNNQPQKGLPSGCK